MQRHRSHPAIGGGPPLRFKRDLLAELPRDDIAHGEWPPVSPGEVKEPSTRGIGSDQSTRWSDDDAGRPAVIRPGGRWGDGIGSTVPIREPYLDRFTADAAVGL